MDGVRVRGGRHDPYKYAWYKSGTLISSTASASVRAPASGGEFELSVDVTDAKGYEGNAYIYVQITCPPAATKVMKTVGGAGPDLCTG